MVIFQFVVPFCWMLSKHIKRNVRILPYIIALLFTVRWLEQLWLVKPGLMAGKFPIHWLDVAAPLALAGIWVLAYCTVLAKAAAVPAPAGHGHGHHHGPQDKGH
jgi:hypothetical protein